MELLAVLNAQQQRIGIAPRDVIHAQGLWHETFHCWLVARTPEPMIYLQLRSDDKKDYAGLYDITAAGHLLANETIEDGLREMAEELGIHATFEQLYALGVVPCEIVTPAITDREFCHVFLYEVTAPPSWQLQQEEVQDVVKITVADFRRLLQDASFTVQTPSLTASTQRTLTQAKLVPHEASYYETLLQQLSAYFSLAI